MLWFLLSSAVFSEEVWKSEDIGEVGVAEVRNLGRKRGIGSCEVGGADVWGTEDSLHVTAQVLEGDGIVVARVSGPGATDDWAKAGLMVRESSAAGSRHAFLVLTPQHGLVWQRRPGTDGRSVSQEILSATLRKEQSPLWLKIERHGESLQGRYSVDGENWSEAGTESFPGLAPVLSFGLAVCSHRRGVLSAADFQQVVVRATVPNLAPWEEAEIGETTVRGWAEKAGETAWTLFGSGADIWGTGDRFHYVYRSLGPEGSLMVQSTGPPLNSGEGWAKAGVMMRESLEPGSRNFFLALTPQHGLVLQRRNKRNGASQSTTILAQAPAPGWLKVERQGKTVRAYHSTEGKNWILAGTMDWDPANPVLIGLAGTSHRDGTVSRAVFTAVESSGTLITVPLPPTGVSVEEQAEGAVRVTWRDQSNQETGFIVQRSGDGGKTWLTVGTTEANVTTVLIPAALTGTEFPQRYRVLARNAAGESQPPSLDQTVRPSLAPPEGDRDGDGLTNLQEYEQGTDPKRADTDADGRSDGEERAEGTDPLDPASFRPVRLGYWSFDDLTLAGDGGQEPLVSRHNRLVPGVKGNGVAIRAESDSLLTYRTVEADGRVNLNLPTGTIRFWMQPQWSSVSRGGVGLQDGAARYFARLLEMGGWTPDASLGSWLFHFSPEGEEIRLYSQNGTGQGENHLNTPIGWSAGVWHQVTLTYTPDQTRLYLDGVRVDTGAGFRVYPAAAVQALGFAVGTDRGGGQRSNAIFDELETYNYPLSAAEVAGKYEAELAQNRDLDDLPDAWEEARFGNLSQTGADDPDGDGLTNLQEYQQGSDPTDYYNGQTPVLEILGATRIDAAPGTVQPLLVRLTNARGEPLARAPLAGAFLTGSGSLRPEGGVFTEGPAFPDLRTDGDGLLRLDLQTSVNQELQLWLQAGPAATPATVLFFLTGVPLSGSSSGNNNDNGGNGSGSGSVGGSGSGNGNNNDNNGGSGSGSNGSGGSPAAAGEDSDGDGVPDRDDVYPDDSRRSRDLPVLSYALIDISGAVTGTNPVDCAALGEDGRMAFSFWEDDHYKVARWKDGALLEPPLIMADQVYTKVAGLWPDSLSTVASQETRSSPVWRARYYHDFIYILNANGDVAGSGRLTNGEWGIALWPYGSHQASNLFNGKLGLYPLDTEQLLDNGDWIGTTETPVPHNYLGQDYWHGVGRAQMDSTEISVLAPVPPVDPSLAPTTECTLSAVSRSGRFAATRLNHDPDSEQTDAVTFDRSGTVQCEIPATGDYYGYIPVINDAGDFIFSGDYYQNSISVGKLLDLFPQPYRQQSQVSPYTLTNAGRILCSGQNLEGPGQGQWVERYFRSDPISGSSTHERDLRLLQFPANWKISFLSSRSVYFDIYPIPSPGPSAMTDSGLIAAYAVQTTDD